MKLYVVRHAHAGSRSAWPDDDRLRPLSKKGCRQATAVAAALADAGIKRAISSPSVRCVETLQPLADVCGLVIEDDERLAEGSTGVDALALADELRPRGDPVAVCSHGDVIPEMLGLLRNKGITFHDPLTWPKGSVWQVDGDAALWTDARLVLGPSRS